MKIAYIVTLFPCWSETFILREIQELAILGKEVLIFSLKPASEKLVHENAKQFIPFTFYPKPVKAIFSTFYAALHHPNKFVKLILKLLIGGIKHPVMLTKTLLMLPIVFRFAEIMKTQDVSHIHAHWATYPSTAAWIIHEFTGIQFSFTAHAHDIWLEKPYLEEKIEDSKFVATISRYNKNYLTRLYGENTRKKLKIVHCGINPESFESKEKCPNGTIELITVGRFDRIKGFEYLIDACEILKNDNITFHLSMIGEGELKPKLVKKAKELGLDSLISFIGAMSQDALKKRMAQSDIFVLPSVQAEDGDQDGIPVVLMEAMAMNIPVISTMVSGIPELVIDKQTGLLIDSRNSKKISEAIIAYVKDPYLRRFCASQGRKYVAAHFNIRNSVMQMLGYFNKKAA